MLCFLDINNNLRYKRQFMFMGGGLSRWEKAELYESNIPLYQSSELIVSPPREKGDILSPT